MNCDQVAAADLPERYLSGDLEGAERDAYEEHYFECEACFRELEILRTAQAVLAKDATNAGPVRKPDPVPRWLPLAAAVMAAATLVGWWTSRQDTVPDQAMHPSPSSPRPSASASALPRTADAARADALVRMARFEPPRYEPPRLRGATPAGAAAFERAMAHYQRGDFAAAVPGIEEHLRRYPEDIGAAFFLGVSQLATHHAAEATRQFERVLAERDSAYEEEALFLLAKAEIERDDLRAAIAALDRTIALGGSRAAEARALREQAHALEGTRK